MYHDKYGSLRLGMREIHELFDATVESYRQKQINQGAAVKAVKVVVDDLHYLIVEGIEPVKEAASAYLDQVRAFAHEIGVDVEESRLSIGENVAVIHSRIEAD